ncbi:hypothetical protein EV361DRAFT_828442, partial [Lentinula raphanica]
TSSYPPGGCWASPVLNHPGVSDPSDGYNWHTTLGEKPTTVLHRRSPSRIETAKQEW